MEISLTEYNIDNYRSGTFPNVTVIRWYDWERLDQDVLARFPNVTNFYCDYKQLKSLQGINELTNLQILRCNHNHITSLQDIGGLTNLQILHCIHNHLTSLQDIGGLTNLQTLICSFNQLTTLHDISGLTNLRKLDCSYSHLTSLQGISGLTNLQTLDCSYNQLTSLCDISGLTNLRKLDCSHDQLTSLQDISGLTNLQTLDCSYNQLASLRGISGLTNLRKLWCGDNRLISLHDISRLTNLQKLYCNDNRLTSLQDINRLTNLQTLCCSDNQITLLDSIIYLRHLHDIVYYDNPIENPSIQVQRFLERLDQQYIIDSSTTIYDDGQNVHDVTIQMSTRKSLSNLMRDTVNKFDITDVLQSPLSESSRNAITEYCSDNTIHSYFLVTYQELFSRVWNRIVNNEHREELIRILDEQIQDSKCKCMTGRFVRTMSVLVGFYDDIVIGISDNAQIAAVIETVRKTIVPYDAQRHADVVHQHLSEMGYDDGQIEPWLEAIMDS